LERASLFSVRQGLQNLNPALLVSLGIVRHTTIYFSWKIYCVPIKWTPKQIAIIRSKHAFNKEEDTLSTGCKTVDRLFVTVHEAAVL